MCLVVNSWHVGMMKTVVVLLALIVMNRPGNTQTFERTPGPVWSFPYE